MHDAYRGIQKWSVQPEKDSHVVRDVAAELSDALPPAMRMDMRRVNDHVRHQMTYYHEDGPGRNLWQQFHQAGNPRPVYLKCRLRPGRVFGHILP